jgi:hypothetical protein
MATLGPIVVPMSTVADRMHVSMEVQVTGLRRFKLRMNLMVWLLRLAAWVAPISASVTVNGIPPESN